MSTFVKVMVALLLTLPLGAYITGTLAASQTDMPPTRVPVVLEGHPSESALPTPSRTPRPSPTSGPTRNRDDRGDDVDDDDDVRVIRPTPREVDDDHGDGGDDRSRHDSDEGDDDD
ncbi:MAG: hypothetical protein ACRDOW_05860 [Nocardioidaceae bacterium]